MEKLEPLYKKSNRYSDDYICMATGNKCCIATEYFIELKNFMKYVVRNKKDFTFVTSELNLCVEQKCPVWNNISIKIAELAKQNTK